MTAKPRKIEQYLAEGQRLAEVVAAHRAATGAASAEAPVTQQPDVYPECNKPRSPRSQRLPSAQYPTELPGWPLNPRPPAEVPDYRTIETASIVVRARKAKGRSLIEPIGPSELRKRDSVSRLGAPFGAREQ
jgi:hypothetical protein